MAPEIGFTFILLALIISIGQPVLLFIGPKTKDFSNQNNLLKASRYSTITVFGCLVLSLFSLIYCYVTSDFSVLNVFLNSNSLKPLIYKISGSWGNHEGSILLLTTILSFYSLAFAYLSNVQDKKKIHIITSQSIITAGILGFIVFTSNPFLRIFPAEIEGLGLNPILQDIGLALHPPMLYTGYIGFSLIFSFAITALINKEIDKEFADKIKPWLIFSWSFLTLGIGLGSWWAYRELGWGGYWFWDPVENVSLMPWLCATALLHSIIILNKTGNFKIWSCFLAILSFVFCLLGIFLVRSGVLTSVHSFANDPRRGIFIIGLLLLIGGTGFLIFLIQSLKIKPVKNYFTIFSKTGLVLINNFLLCLALFVVALGTIYPLILQSLFDTSISIGPFYYQKILSPVALAILFLMIFVPYLKLTDRVFNYKIIKPAMLIITLSALLTAILFITKFEVKFIPLSAIFFSIAIIFSSLFYFRKIISDKKITLNYLSMLFGHMGIAIVIIGIAVSSLLSKSKELNMKVGEETTIADYKIKFENLDYDSGKNYMTRIGVFQITRNNNSNILRPETRYYPVSDQSTTEADIKHKILSDLYLVIGNKDQKENFAVRIYYKPFISFIWLGCLIIFISGLLSLLKNRLNKALKINSNLI